MLYIVPIVANCTEHACELCGNCLCIMYQMFVHCAPPGCAFCGTWLFLQCDGFGGSIRRHKCRVTGVRRKPLDCLIQYSLSYSVTRCASMYVETHWSIRQNGQNITIGFLSNALACGVNKLLQEPHLCEMTAETDSWLQSLLPLLPLLALLPT